MLKRPKAGSPKEGAPLGYLGNTNGEMYLQVKVTRSTDTRHVIEGFSSDMSSFMMFLPLTGESLYPPSSLP